MTKNLSSAQEMFSRAPFIRQLGMTLKDYREGWAETHLAKRDEHLQQHGFIHAAVVTAMADHTAGVAATTLLEPSEQVLTLEFKVNFLRPATGTALRCRSETLRKGKAVAVVESWVYSLDRDGGEKLCAKATITLAVTKQSSEPS